jgi:ATP-dependent DNA helicase HFM1/MER3
MRVILADKPYRIMAVSATIPNTENLANWLRCHKSGKPAKILKFPDSMRPVLLKTHVVAVPMNGKNGFTFDFSLNYKLTDIITKYSENKPTLIVYTFTCCFRNNFNQNILVLLY